MPAPDAPWLEHVGILIYIYPKHDLNVLHIPYMVGIWELFFGVQDFHGHITCLARLNWLRRRVCWWRWSLRSSHRSPSCGVEVGSGSSAEKRPRARETWSCGGMRVPGEDSANHRRCVQAQGVKSVETQILNECSYTAWLVVWNIFYFPIY